MAASASAHAWQTPAPPLAGHLVDEARMLTPAEADALESTLAMLLLVVLLSGDSSKTERKGSGNTGGIGSTFDGGAASLDW